MPHLLFSLRGVPDDEAEDIRDLLEKNAIDFYETSAGNWGISMPALWLRDRTQLTEAQQLINRYQLNRAATQRARYEQLKKQGKAPTLWGTIKKAPSRYFVYLSGVALIIYVSIKLVFEFGLSIK
ncbi:MAG: DUF6164 family protein [Methylomicrobium sp.]